MHIYVPIKDHLHAATAAISRWPIRNNRGLCINTNWGAEGRKEVKTQEDETKGDDEEKKEGEGEREIFKGDIKTPTTRRKRTL